MKSNVGGFEGLGVGGLGGLGVGGFGYSSLIFASISLIFAYIS